jgi:hypothetical protein
MVYAALDLQAVGCKEENTKDVCGDGGVRDARGPTEERAFLKGVELLKGTGKVTPFSKPSAFTSFDW